MKEGASATSERFLETHRTAEMGKNECKSKVQVLLLTANFFCLVIGKKSLNIRRLTPG